MRDRKHLFFALVVLSSAAVACTKSDGPPGTTSGLPSASGSMASATAPATAAPDASPMAADTTTGNAPTGGADATAPMGSAAASAGTMATVTASASAGAASAPACGTKPLPDCPLQAWMKANTNTAIASGDLPALATALDKAASFAPAGYSNWATISKDGAKAAKGGDMTAAKASCRTGHDQYKEKYKKEMRARKI